MRKKPIRLLLVSFVVLFAACSNLEVNTARAPDANLAQYRTYAWISRSEPKASSVTDQTVKSNVQEQLINKGLVPSQSGEPDLLISYFVREKTGFSRGLSPSEWGWDQEAVYPVREGDLKLQFIDPKTNRAVWEGTASDVIGRAGPTQKEIADSVTEILKRYPQG
jgi:hypothetical protein